MVTETKPLILIVEDDEGAGILLRRRLERSGFRVELARDVADAMTLLAPGKVDLVVMDYRLGGTTGLDLHRQMRTAGFDVPVIMITGSTDDVTVIEAMRAGVRDFIVKTTDYLDYVPSAARNILSQVVNVPERLPEERRVTTVLVVEDDEGTATLMRRQLERRGFDVAVAAGPEAALHLLRSGRIDLALIDLHLEEGASGLELYERFKAEGWTLPAILVTGFPDEQIAIRALRAGIRDFVPKSGDYLDYLPLAVERVAAQARLERKLVDSELRLASIIGTTMDAIVMFVEPTGVVLFNHAAEEMFGYPAAEALGQRLDLFMPSLKLDESPAAGGGGPSSRVQRRVEIDGVRRDGGRVPIEATVSGVFVSGRRLFTVIARDISERRRIEAELRLADRRKDEFLGMLAHELRNPLAAIMNAGEVLDRVADDQRTLKLIAVVKRQTRALTRMVDDLLDVSRVTLGKIRLSKEPLLLSQVVGRAVDAARDAAARAQIVLQAAIDPEPVWLEADATRLEQVLTNLLNNAVKFTPAGGRIDVTAGREDGSAVIRVRDTGIGMDAALLPTVFDLFVQADTSLDRSKSGLGIGLALVRQVVELHGGIVQATSAGLNTGSEFVVRLPAAPEELVPSREPHAPAAHGKRRLRVLVVDDQQDMADCVALLIEAIGHHARAVYDGETALTVARSQAIDVMFVDIGMPGVTGYDVARKVRAHPELARIRLVALTGYGGEEDRRRALGAGFDLHLTKPVADSTLQALLADLEPGE